MNSSLYYLFSYFAVLPLLKMAGLCFARACAKQDSSKDKAIRIIVNTGLVLDTFALIAAFVKFPLQKTTLTFDHFIFHGWELFLVWDKITLAALTLCVLCFNIIGKFSLSYLQKDRYLTKFYLLLFVFQFSTCFFIFSESTQFLFMGWELLGLSSVLLIAFYEHRPNVLKNSLRVLVAYKISDLFLFGSFLYLLHIGITDINSISSNTSISPLILFCLALACLIKSGLFPWFWLPRAMEGPTTSSALFYGSIATHLPVFIFLRVWPHHIAASHPLFITLMIILITAILFSTLIGRQIADVKNSLAYATVSQLALIYIEIMLGFSNLALLHTLGHAFFRGFEYLKSPSQLYLNHKIEKTRTAFIDKTGVHWEFILPKAARNWLYAITMKEFGLFKSSFGLVDHFLGLKQTRIDKKSFLKFSFFAGFFWLLLEMYFVEFGQDPIQYLEETFVLLALLSSAFAFKNMYRKGFFWLFLTLSVILCFDVLEAKIVPDLVYTEHALALIILSVGAFSFFQKEKLSIQNFEPHFSTKKTVEVLLFILGLSIIGIPGLGSYFIWESLVHDVSRVSPHLVLESFYVLSINTVVFFSFFYMNYLGNKKEPVC
ncbi:MAG: hypothetical protein H7A33_05220 [Deltaproteobacteria bacterium]|nr:hypothetical protein [Deltaproteobacteria bacterium]